MSKPVLVKRNNERLLDKDLEDMVIGLGMKRKVKGRSNP
jgi:hypothetical protein